MTRYRNSRKRRQPPKVKEYTLPPVSEDKQMEDFLGCCEYSVEQFEANRNSNLLNASKFSCLSSPIAMWYLASQKEEFESQRAQYTSHCRCHRYDQPYFLKKEGQSGFTGGGPKYPYAVSVGEQGLNDGNGDPESLNALNASEVELSNDEDDDSFLDATVKVKEIDREHGLNGDNSKFLPESVTTEDFELYGGGGDDDSKCLDAVKKESIGTVELKNEDSKIQNAISVENTFNSQLGLKDNVTVAVEKENKNVVDAEVEETVQSLLFRVALFENEIRQAVVDTMEDLVSEVLAMEAGGGQGK